MDDEPNKLAPENQSISPAWWLCQNLRAVPHIIYLLYR